MAKTPTRKKPQPKVYPDVSAEPVKSFFVDMLTRDIRLADALLDLLDNCVDGILRTKKGSLGTKTPYKGFYAHITYDKNDFQITDNCGGIPWSQHEYAFRMGRVDSERDSNMPTVGVYGIGMKRAIFKIGRHSLIQTQHKQDAYDVEFKPSWLNRENLWTIPVSPSASRMPRDGTTICVSELNPGVRSLFGADKARFDQEFTSLIATHYAFIINKGFTVKVNGQKVSPRPTQLRFETGRRKTVAIRPYMYKGTINGVDVFLAVGLTHPIPSEADISAGQLSKQHSSLDAGWTVICNDRAVVYGDRTELTGWGEASVPQYHTQFISISGVVEFRSNDASKLPTTTTKRGIDASSRLYLQVKNKMREGLRMFTDFTNKWKGRELAKEAQARIRKAPSQSLQELKALSKEVGMRKLSRGVSGTQYKPRLPMPTSAQSSRSRIVFVRDNDEIQDAADHLLGDANAKPNKVGEACFDYILSEARQ